MIEIREYLDPQGRSPFGRWFSELDKTAAAKVVIALTRITLGNLSNVKGVGSGVLEYKINYGPGYRIYFGRDGESLVILLAGGSKKRQPRDVEVAQARWHDYKQRKLKDI
jgi:putative addiction module killer protein